MRGVVREQGEQLLQAEGPVERALTSLGVLEAPGVQGELVARETVQAAPEMERAVREALGSPGMARWTLRVHQSFSRMACLQRIALQAAPQGCLYRPDHRKEEAEELRAVSPLPRPFQRPEQRTGHWSVSS